MDGAVLASSAFTLVGIVVGGVLTHLLQARATKRAELVRARDEQRNAVVALCEALIAFESIQLTRARYWDAPDDQAREEVRLESYRAKAQAMQQLARVQMFVGVAAVVSAAESAYTATDQIVSARGFEQAIERRDEASAARQRLTQLTRDLTGA